MIREYIYFIDDNPNGTSGMTEEEIIRCKDCKHWHEWENGTGSCHRSNIMWVGSDYDDYCSFAELKEGDEE